MHGQLQAKAGDSERRTQTAGKYTKVDHAVLNRLSHEIPYHARQPSIPSALERCPPVWVDTEANLREAAGIISSAKRIALDVEHHSVHTYFGKTCLIQIATEQTDYLIDALALWLCIPTLLGPIFANDTILKVVHGGSSDVVWLLRDFGIRLVNIFDTEKACRALNYQQFSLAYLLGRFCNVETDKSLQRADWRTRPLSKKQVKYAQMDVHYLLYVADCLLKDLLAAMPEPDAAGNQQFHPRSQLGRAVRSSQALSLKQWCPESSQAASMQGAQTVLLTHILANPDTGDELSESNLELIGARTLVICAWRDAIAREVDDGVQCIMPDTAVSKLATLPICKSVQQLKDTVNDIAATNSFSGQTPCKFPEAVLSNADVLFANIQNPDVSQWRQLARNLEVNRRGRGKEGDVLIRQGLRGKHKAIKSSDPSSWKEILGARFGVKKPCYENCKMLSRTNEVLCYTDRKRLLWYVRKGLAEEIDPGSEPLTVRLLFDHKDEDQRAGKHTFYSTARANRCVGCGADRHYLRFRVVPACYRKALPPCLKSHRSHDVVLLCIDCHQIAQTACERTKREIAHETHIPLYPHFMNRPLETADDREKDDNSQALHPFNVRKAAIALQKHGENLPEARRRQLERQVSTYVRSVEPWLSLSQHDPWDETTELWAGLLAGLGPSSRRKMIKRWIGENKPGTLPDALMSEVAPAHGSNRRFGDPCKGHEWHGRAVVDYLYGFNGGEKALVALCARFRKSFVDAVNPLYLPQGWTVDHAALRSFGSFSVYAGQGQHGD